MARGWDSKAIEDQIADAEASKAARERPYVSPAQRETLALVRSLELSRTQVLQRLEATRDERYLAQLHAALEHLDSRLRELEPESDSS